MFTFLQAALVVVSTVLPLLPGCVHHPLKVQTHVVNSSARDFFFLLSLHSVVFKRNAGVLVLEPSDPETGHKASVLYNSHHVGCTNKTLLLVTHFCCIIVWSGANMTAEDVRHLRTNQQPGTGSMLFKYAFIL